MFCHQPVVVQLEEIAADLFVAVDCDEVLGKGFEAAQLQSTKGQTALLEASYACNKRFIAHISNHLQQVMLPQLQACVSTTLQRMCLPHAQQQADRINDCAHALLHSLCTPGQQHDMHMEIPLQLDRALTDLLACDDEDDKRLCLDVPEPTRQLMQQWTCYAEHNMALNKARHAQSKIINEMLACACGPELVRRLAEQLQRRAAVEPYVARAVLSKLRTAPFLLAPGDDSLLQAAAAAARSTEQLAPPCTERLC